MPPKRSTRTSTSNQSTLAFHGAAARVTKPSAQTSTKSKFFDGAKPLNADSKLKRLSSESAASVKSAASSGSNSDVDEHPDDDILPPTVAEIAIEQQAREVKKEVAQERTKEEEEALKIKDAQLKKYWKEQGKKSKPMTGRVHQENLSLEEKILRQWDTSAQYGPCIGIARIKRWKRAQKLRMNPPIEVLAVLLKQEGVSQRAHVDELMSSRFIET